jgi:hypothetical protein
MAEKYKIKCPYKKKALGAIYVYTQAEKPLIELGVFSFKCPFCLKYHAVQPEQLEKIR